MGRLVGDQGMEKLFRSHVMVVGLGGVGSFAVEALARSGVGRLTLVDFDRVCTTNSNRQLQAVHKAIGKRKADVLAERVFAINPQINVTSQARFYDKRTSDQLLSLSPDYVIDAIDNVTAKIHLLATCREQGIRVVCSTGASGRIDPTKIRIADLSETYTDPLAAIVRKLLRRDYGFSRDKTLFGIPAVFSTEAARQPKELTYDHGNGFRCVCPGGTNEFHSCDNRNVIYGTAGFVTGTFGLTAASVVVRDITGEEQSW